MKTVGSVFYVDNFIQGQQDCKEGKPHQSGRGDAYDDGYQAQYEKEAIQAEMSKNVRP